MPSLALAPPPRAAARLALFLLCVVGCTTAAVARDGQVNLFTDGSSTMVIDQPGSYVLVADVQMTGDQVGLRVDASDVTIDLNGHTLRGTSPLTAIGVEVMAGRGNVALRNGVVANFGYGVRGREQTTIEDVRFADTGFYAVIGGRANVVARCTVTRAGSAADGAADPLGTPPGTLFRAGIAVGERSLVERCVVGQVGSESATADVVGIIAGGASRVAGNVVDNLDAAGGWMSGIRAEADSLVAENVVRDLAASSGRVDGIGAGERSTLRGNRVSQLGGAQVVGLAGRDVTQSGEFLEASQVSFEACEVAAIGGFEVGQPLYGVRAGDRSGVAGCRVTGLAATTSQERGTSFGPARGVSLGESSSVRDCQIADVRGASHAGGVEGAQGVAVSHHSVIERTTVANLQGAATSNSVGLLVGDNCAVVASFVFGMSGGDTGGGAGVRGGWNVQVKDVLISELYGSGGWTGVLLGARGSAERVTIRNIVSDSDSYGIRTGASGSVLDCDIQHLTLNQTGLLAAIEVDLNSRIERCSIQSVGSVGGAYVGVRAARGGRVLHNTLSDLEARAAESFTAIEGQTHMTITGNEVRNLAGGAGTSVFGIVAGRNSAITGNRLQAITGAIPHGIRLTSLIAGGTSDFGNHVADNVILDLVAQASTEGEPGGAIVSDLPVLIEGNQVHGITYTTGLTGRIRNSAIRSMQDAVIARNSIMNIFGESDYDADTGRPFAAIEILEQAGGINNIGRPVITGNVISDIYDADNFSAAIYTNAVHTLVEANVFARCGYANWLAREAAPFNTNNLITNNRAAGVKYLNMYYSSRASVTTDNTVNAIIMFSVAARGVQVSESLEEGNRVYLDY